MKSCYHVQPGASQCFDCRRMEIERDMVQRQYEAEERRRQEINGMLNRLNSNMANLPYTDLIPENLAGRYDFNPPKPKKKVVKVNKKLYERLKGTLS